MRRGWRRKVSKHSDRRRNGVRMQQTFRSRTPRKASKGAEWSPRSILERTPFRSGEEESGGIVDEGQAVESHSHRCKDGTRRHGTIHCGAKPEDARPSVDSIAAVLGTEGGPSARGYDTATLDHVYRRERAHVRGTDAQDPPAVSGERTPGGWRHSEEERSWDEYDVEDGDVDG
ncbi:hypothetical protein B0H19DRAFT_1074599 [Mycena capillaripes]|nr:hypothetical protein B0H19DRAFT_1074599 [Mycena capillaripes]